MFQILVVVVRMMQCSMLFPITMVFGFILNLDYSVCVVCVDLHKCVSVSVSVSSGLSVLWPKTF